MREQTVIELKAFQEVPLMTKGQSTLHQEYLKNCLLIKAHTIFPKIRYTIIRAV